MITNPSDQAQGTETHNAASRPILSASRANTRFLLGFFQAPEVEPYLQNGGVLADPQDLVRLKEEWGTAHEYVSALISRPETETRGVTECAHTAALRAEPTFVEHAGGATVVELVFVQPRRIVACQPHVDLDHIDHLKAIAPRVGDEEGLLKFCLPLQREGAQFEARSTFNRATNTFSLLVDNPDVRLCGSFQAGQAETGRGMVGFTVGTGLHQMNVIEHAGRYMLNNGYHRAVALAELGHEWVPLILTHIQNREGTPAARPGMFGPPIVFGAVPPRIEDFLSAASVTLHRKRNRTLITLHAEVFQIPA